MDLYSVVDRRAKSFLSDTAKKFTAFQWHELSGGVATVLNPGLDARIFDLKLLQVVSSKLVGRIYSFKWQWCVSTDLGCEQKIAKLKFSGWKNSSRSARFEGAASSADLVSKLNESDTVLSLCLAMDVVALEVKYNADSKVCEVKCLPSYGDYIWLLIPPLRYASHPTPAEIEGTILLVEEVSKAVAHI